MYKFLVFTKSLFFFCSIISDVSYLFSFFSNKISNSVPNDNNCANVISLSDDEADEQIEQIFMDPRKDPARTVEVFDDFGFDYKLNIFKS